MYCISNGNLYHYGVKGMKWGVIRTPEQLGHTTTTKKKKQGTLSKFVQDQKKKSAEKKASKAASQEKTKSTDNTTSTKKKSVSEMSDEELRSAISRLQMEKQFQDLTAKKEPSKKSSLTQMSDVMQKVSKIAVNSAATITSVSRIYKTLDDLLDDTDTKKGKK